MTHSLKFHINQAIENNVILHEAIFTKSQLFIAIQWN